MAAGARPRAGTRLSAHARPELGRRTSPQRPGEPEGCLSWVLGSPSRHPAAGAVRFEGNLCPHHLSSDRARDGRGARRGGVPRCDEVRALGGVEPARRARDAGSRATSTSTPRPPSSTTAPAPAPRPHPAHPRPHTQPIRTTPTTNHDAVALMPSSTGASRPPDPATPCDSPTTCDSPTITDHRRPADPPRDTHTDRDPHPGRPPPRARHRVADPDDRDQPDKALLAWRRLARCHPKREAAEDERGDRDGTGGDRGGDHPGIGQRQLEEAPTRW